MMVGDEVVAMHDEHEGYGYVTRIMGAHHVMVTWELPGCETISVVESNENLCVVSTVANY